MPQHEKFAAREQALRYRLTHYLSTASQQQIDALAKVLFLEKQDAYRLALQREAAKWGVTAYGPLDPFVAAALQADAALAARHISSTYMMRQNQAQMRALAAGQPFDQAAWREQYLSWKPAQILQYEYGKAAHKALVAFYDNNTLPATAHVEPRTAAVPDDCQDWIDLGEIPVDEIADKPLPRHPHCPHEWFSSKQSERTLPLAPPIVPSALPRIAPPVLPLASPLDIVPMTVSDFTTALVPTTIPISISDFVSSLTADHSLDTTTNILWLAGMLATDQESS